MNVSRKSSMQRVVFSTVLPITHEANRIYYHVTEHDFSNFCGYQCDRCRSVRRHDLAPVSTTTARGAALLDACASHGFLRDTGLYFDGSQYSNQPGRHLLFSPVLRSGSCAHAGLAWPG